MIPRIRLLAAVVIGLGLIGIFLLGQAATADAPTFQAAPESGPAIVTVEIFSNFSCPHCRAFALDTLPRLRAAYGAVVRFVPRPLGWNEHEQALAVAAECAAQQGLYWDYHERLFDLSPAAGTPELVQLAGEHGLDTARFEACLADSVMARTVARNLSDSAARDVTGVPTIFVAGGKIVGAQPYEVFAAAIDGALARPASDAPAAAWLSADQQVVVDDFGYPDAFRLMEIDSADGMPSRYAYWTYFKGGITYVFRDGVFLSATAEPYPPGGVLPTPYRPEHFVLGDSLTSLQARFDGGEWGAFPVEGDLLPGGEVVAGDRLLLGFLDGQLVYVETLALAQGADR